MTNGQKSTTVEVPTASPATARAPRAPGPDPLAATQQALGNRDFGRLVGAPSSPAGSENAADEETREARPVASFVVEDDAAEVGPGQMRRTPFLAAVRAAVCGTANEGFQGTGRTADDCPFIEHWLSVYEQRDAAHLNGALGRFAPETGRAANAGEAVAMIAARVRRSVDAYAATGEISGVPDEMSAELPGGGLLGGLFGGLLFKAGPGGPPASATDPRAVRGQLGPGQPMSGGVRSRMERAFGVSFSRVRVHRDGAAAALSSGLNARAFTVGHDVAFASGEYRPGTLIGDALIAHELAHVVQQREAVDAGRGDGASIERDADTAAVDAVVSTWAGRPAAAAGRPHLAALKTGLRLSRCGPSTAPSDLTTFLETLERDGPQTGFYDDDRARAVVAQWKAGAEGFNLTPRLKARLIKTMLDGDVGDDDKRAILDLLELSDNGDLRLMFTVERVDPNVLDRKIGGAHAQELQAFYTARFVRGRKALAEGHVAPQGAPAEGAPAFAYSWPELERRVVGYLPEDAAEWIRSLPPDAQVQARRDLNDKRAEAQRKSDEIVRLIERRILAAAAKARTKPATIDPFEVAPREMLAAREHALTAERIEAVLYALGLDVAGRGVKAAEDAAKAAEEAAKKSKDKTGKDDIKATLVPPVPSSQAAAFTDPAGYETTLRAGLKKLVDAYHKEFVQNVSRADLYPLDRLAEIANAARDAVSGVFGAWASGGGKLVPGVNLIDRFEEVETKFQDIPVAERPEALKQIARDKILSMLAAEKDLRAIHRRFKASPEFDEHGAPTNDPARIQRKLADEIADTDAQRVFEIVRGWPGSHREGTVKLQTTKQPKKNEREHFWKLFQTSIHEYIHSLMSDKYRTYAESFPGKTKSRQHNTLVEGVASVLHEMAWQAVKPKLPGLRATVEGPDYKEEKFDEAVLPDITRIRYGSYEEAQALIARVGIGNVLLAFFKGRTDLIGE